MTVEAQNFLRTQNGIACLKRDVVVLPPAMYLVCLWDIATCAVNVSDNLGDSCYICPLQPGGLR